jgi:integrase/recombinase XerD
LGAGAHVCCHGKGRKDRATPLSAQTATTLATWFREYDCGPTDPVFPTRRGRPLSTDAVAWLLTKRAATAVRHCPSLNEKHLTPHVLRHTADKQLLHSGADISVIALWLGHESVQTTQIYLHADLALKEKALVRIAPPSTPPGRYHPPDALLAFLEAI